MKISKVWTTLLIVPLLAVGVYEIQSNGAPMGSTNAPGELTCNRSGCHTGQPLNSGGAALSVTVGDGQGYVPGMVYPVTVEIAELGKERFGFQTLALHDQDTTNAGTWIVTDSLRTKALAGIQQFAGRQYMTYKFPGTAPVSPGVGRWTFDWQAPSEDVGPVTFYTASAVANNDGTDQGEFIYTQALTLTALPTDVAAAASSAAPSSIFPNPSNGIVHVSYFSTGKEATSVFLVRAATGHCQLLQQRRDGYGRQVFSVDLGGKFAAGNYLLYLRHGALSECHRLILLP